MHAFDRDAVTGPIAVRLAPRGREADHPRRRRPASSTTDDLLITDDTGPIGLAAVMGGASTEIGDGTTDVLLEAAHWEPTGVAPHRPPAPAAQRGGQALRARGRPGDDRGRPRPGRRAARRVRRRDGRRRGRRRRHPRARGRPSRSTPPGRRGSRVCPTPPPRSWSCSARSAATSTRAATRWSVTPPSWRPDLTDPADLVEEVVRLAGYDDVPSVLPTAPPGRGLTDVQRRRRSSRPHARRGGLRRGAVLPVRRDGGAGRPRPARRRPAPCRRRRPATRCRRRSRRCARRCCPACSPRCRRNLSRGQRDLALFEHGAVFPGGDRRTPAPLPGVERRPDDETLAALLGAVPEQPWHVAVALAGNREPRGWWGAGPRGGLGRRRAGRPAGAPPPRVSSSPCGPGSWRPGTRAAAPSCSSATGWSATPASCTRGCARRWSCRRARRSWSSTSTRCRRPRCRSARPSRASRRCCIDLALVVKDEVPAAEVAGRAREGAGELLESLRLFDVYTGPPVPEGARSLAYALDAPGAGPHAHQRGGDRGARCRRRRCGERTGPSCVAEKGPRPPTLAGSGRCPGRAASAAGQVALVTGASSGIGRTSSRGWPPAVSPSPVSRATRSG